MLMVRRYNNVKKKKKTFQNKIIVGVVNTIDIIYK